MSHSFGWLAGGCLLPGKLSLHSDKLISCTNNQAACTCEAGKCPKSAGEAILKRISRPTRNYAVIGVNLEICFRGIILMNQGDFDSLRGSCTAPSNKHVCFTGSLYNYVCKVWGIHNRPIPHKLIGWANYFLLKCWGKNHDVMLPFKHCFNGKSVQF